MNENDKEGGHGNGPGGSSVHRQASEWLVLLESGDATDPARARFEAWLAEDPAHREAYAGLSETWGRLTALRERVRAAGHLESGRDLAMPGLGAPGPTRRRKPALAWAAAASVLLAAVLAGILLLPDDPPISYHTEVGERRTVSLTDGSTVELNTDTEVLVEYTDAQRRIAMIRGEAFFEVAEAPGRPFVVTAGQGVIRAVGTGFAVRLKSADVVSVMVTEGIVEVARRTAESSTAHPEKTAGPPLLQRGQRAEYDRDATRIEEITVAELERTQAWRRGLLVFEDASLAEVVAEVNRYTETQLVLADPDVGELRLGGTFKTGRVEALLEVLEKGFGVRASRDRPGTIELHAPPANPAS